MTVEAPAKINLGLHVLRRRDDGYHDIETVMLRLRWFDTIEAEADSGLAMTCTDSSLSVGSDNLCIRAAAALRSRFGIGHGVRLHLTKRIPAGAGLGGGSSDAAATLRALNRLWGLNATDDDLSAIGAELGSDVPFFLGPSPAVARGRGEDLSQLTSDDGSLLRIPFTFVLIRPDASVATADAYRWVTPSDEFRVDLASLIRSADLSSWRSKLINDFELPVEERIPDVKALKTLLYGAGAGFAGMTGSGSAVYGVFEQTRKAEIAAEAARRAGYPVVWRGKAE